MGKGGIIPIRLNGKTYMGWAFALKRFVKGPGLATYLDGTVASSDEKAKGTSSQSNSKVVTWILNFIDPSIILSLQSFRLRACGNIYKNCINRLIRYAHSTWILN